MSSHRIIGSYNSEPVVLNFEFWRGEPPQILHERTAVHTRPGADGIAAQKLGSWGRPFTAQLVSHWPFYQAAMAILPSYFGLQSNTLNVVYNLVDFRITFGVRHLALDVSFVNAQSNVLLMGPDYIYPNGCELTTEWTLIPVSAT